MNRAAALSIGLLLACGPKVDDGIFDAGMTGRRPEAAGAETSADPTPPEDDEDDGTSTTTGDESSTGDPTDDPAETTTTAEDHGCPEAVGPSTFECPPGSTFWTEGTVAQCRYEDLTLPTAPSLFSYCAYFDMGYLGFGWTLTEAPDFACPPGSRYAPNATIGYCLWQDLEPPPGALATCTALTTEHWLGFQWPCP